MQSLTGHYSAVIRASPAKVIFRFLLVFFCWIVPPRNFGGIHGLRLQDLHFKDALKIENLGSGLCNAHLSLSTI